jgi:hypothetical protein
MIKNKENWKRIPFSFFRVYRIDKEVICE